MQAEFVGSDPDTDVALMRIPAPKDGPLTAIPLADSSKLQVGDFVVAVGNPFGIGQTVTSGLVRSEEHTSELQSLMRNSYAVFCLKKKNKHIYNTNILLT